MTVLRGSGLALLPVLSLRSRGTGLTVGVLLGGITTRAGLTVRPVRVGLAIGAIDRWLTHKHVPQGFFGCVGMRQGPVRLQRRPRSRPGRNSPSPPETRRTAVIRMVLAVLSHSARRRSGLASASVSQV